MGAQALPLRPRDVRNIAREYDAASDIADPSLVPLWCEYADLMVAEMANQADRFVMRIVNSDMPYNNGAELLRDLVARRYKVPASTTCPVHPVWDGVRFAASRAVHDITGHGAAGTDFTLGGEIPTFHMQAQWLRDRGREDLICVVFSDTMQQLCSTLFNHRFAPQKVTLTEYERCLERCLDYDV